MYPHTLKIEDFTYVLPTGKIAKYPLNERGESKLLVYKSGGISTSTYNNIYKFLASETLMIFNDTRVVEARLLFKKPTGGVIEIFCLEPHEQYSDITSAMRQGRTVLWKCLIGGASKWKHGIKLHKQILQHEELEATIIERRSDCFIIKFEWTPPNLSFAEILHIAGSIPLPPYLHRDAETSDLNRYQTTYATQHGSVAAPTAGLHFTPEIFTKLERKGIDKAFVTLHVGAGTFMPVKAQTLEQHTMHSEFIDVSAETIRQIIPHLKTPIVTVGTTSLRTIESLYWLGAKIKAKPDISPEQLVIHQWEPYEKESNISASDALQTLLDWMTEKNSSRLITKTQILIAPGYKLRVAKGLVTNFHQPNSTLLLLVAAIVGEDWKRIYQYALDHDFRFLSYGDGCLLWANE